MAEIIKGQIVGNERGYAFLVLEDNSKQDYFISHSDLKGAMHGDKVIATPISSRGGKRTVARVLKVLERGIEKLTGTFFTSKMGGYVVPDEKKYFTNITISHTTLKNIKVKSGDKVVCKITDYPPKQKPQGYIIKVLGRQFEKTAELKSLFYTYKVPEKFPKPVLWQANEFPNEVEKDDLKGRADFTDKITFTIDGETAKDFDDAISVERLENGCYLLGVHIADVSHYVKEGSEIDKEAYNRGTSIYFPESVTPMLPEALSNNLCSLKEGVIRLTLSCMMTIDSKGKVINANVTPAYIKSRARTTYTKIQKLLDGEILAEEKYQEIYSSVMLAKELAQKVDIIREKEGVIDLDVKESQITVDKNGKICVTATQSDSAHKLIETFMILANVSVAEYMYYLENPCIYRVHEEPTEEKIFNFYTFLDAIGVKYKKKKDEIHSKDYQQILKNVEGSNLYTLINRVMLRSMQKAKYSQENLGHFGLSLKCYCHFTSPIRRYPDLVVHRILKEFLSGKTTEELKEKYSDFADEASSETSKKERNAIEAERAVDDYYKLLYISSYVGEEFDGIISGVTNFGIFVELENGIEGIVKVESLAGRFRYELNQTSYTLSNGKTSYRLGQSLKIKVVGVNYTDRRAEFIISAENSIAIDKKK